MRSFFVSLLVAALASAVPAVAQNPASRSVPEDVVKLGTTLVQVDAVVTDKKGVPVTDLTADDFEVLQDKRPQEVTAVSYVDTTATSSPASAASKSVDPATAGAPAPIAGSLRQGDVRRTIAIVFDDLHLSAERVTNVKYAIRELVEKQTQPGDLVAIIRTSGGVGALQQFTSDRRVLEDAIDHLRWTPRSGLGVSSFERVPLALLRPEKSAGQADDAERDRRAEQRGDLEKRNSATERDVTGRAFAGGTMGTLSFVLEGMALLPGRKSLVMFSEGWTLIDDKGVPNGNVEYLQKVADLAGRASATIYTADARGLVNPLYAAAEFGVGEAPDLSQALRDSQDPLRMIADETGGSMFASNDMGRQLRRAVDDLKGYYLIAYTPDVSTFDEQAETPRFHPVEVRVKRTGLKVRSRSGFFGVTDAEVASRRSVTDRLSEAVASPFVASDVRLRLTPLFMSETKDDATVRAYLHVDGRDLEFKDIGDGKLAAPVNLVAVLFGDNGRAVSHAETNQSLEIPADGLDKIRRRGVVFTLNLPVEKPGVYQLRTAVRDVGGDRYGSAQQIVEVPKLKDHHLALSGVVLSTMSHLIDPNVDTEPIGAAVRRFRPGTEISYAFAAYNPKSPNAETLPSLDLKVSLWRDGERVFEGPAQRMQLTPQRSWERVYSKGNMRLSERLKPGEYILEVSVLDRLADRKHADATQWIDFEVVDPASEPPAE